jgi:hypothetical protein
MSSQQHILVADDDSDVRDVLVETPPVFSAAGRGFLAAMLYVADPYLMIDVR